MRISSWLGDACRRQRHNRLLGSVNRHVRDEATGRFEWMPGDDDIA